MSQFFHSGLYWHELATNPSRNLYLSYQKLNRNLANMIHPQKYKKGRKESLFNWTMNNSQ